MYDLSYGKITRVASCLCCRIKKDPELETVQLFEDRRLQGLRAGELARLANNANTTHRKLKSITTLKMHHFQYRVIVELKRWDGSVDANAGHNENLACAIPAWYP